MRTVIAVAGALFCAPLLVAQQESAARHATAEARMKALEQQQRQMIEQWIEASEAAEAAAEKAKAAGAPVPAPPARPDYAPILALAEAAAKDYAGTDDAVQFLQMVLRMSSDVGQRTAAMRTLVTSHVDSAALAQLGAWLPRLSQAVEPSFAKEALPKLAASKNAEVRDWATYAMCKDAIDSAPRDGAEYAAAKATLLETAKATANKDLGREITSAIETREQYGVGVMAPDIEGEDLDGVAFKLSDYKGKILFLDFWGDW